MILDSPRKVALLKLTAWGQIDPLLYSKAFTGPGRAKPHAACPICLQIGHSMSECSFYCDEPAKGVRATPGGLGPRAINREICISLNRGRCLQNECPHKHICSVTGCGGSHASLHCPRKRYSPPKTLVAHTPCLLHTCLITRHLQTTFSPYVIYF